MAFSSASSNLSATPNVTPLIDVLLVLLIIFMTIVPLSPHGLESSLPQPAPDSPARVAPLPVVLRVIRPAGPGAHITYRIGGQSLDLTQLRPVLRDTRARSTAPTILIGGDPQLDYQPVVTAISEARQAGFQRIGLLTRDDSASLSR